MNRKKLARRTALAARIKRDWMFRKLYTPEQRLALFMNAFDSTTREFIRRADSGQHPWPGGRGILNNFTV